MPHTHSSTHPLLPPPSIGTSSHGNYVAEFLFVTPEMASEWLELNVKNRNLDQKRVTDYAADMDAGRWEFDGATIRFAASGSLLDGQHRLQAIITHGRPVLCLVVSGLGERSQDVMDTGRKRTASDMFSIHGRPSPVLVASVARMANAWNEGRIRTSQSTIGKAESNALLRDVVADDPTIEWAATTAAQCSKEIPAKPTAIGFSLWLTGRADAAASIEFFESLRQMRTDGEGDPRYTALRRLQAAKQGRESLTSVEEAFILVRAWNAWRRGESLKIIKSSTSAGPSIFPPAS